MFHALIRLTPVIAAGALTVTAATSGAHAEIAHRSPGPSWPFTHELITGEVVPLVHAARLTRTKHGYRYQAGKQDSHLVVTRVKAGLRFRDTGTQKWKGLSGRCHARRAHPGIAAVCRLPAGISQRNPLLLEIWPRLGDDHIDGRTLPAAIQMAVLADKGRDVVHTGAGNDFVNGAQNGDRVRGGAGSDWLRTGKGNDRIWGGSGVDKIVGVDGNDRLWGGGGSDVVYGGSGRDRLHDGDGRAAYCGPGRDAARVARGARAFDCEAVRRG